jgi:hypothetical protein
VNFDDTARLDFLERTQTALYIISHEEWRHGDETESRLEKTSVFDGWCAGSSTKEYRTPREAIDAIMLLHEK